MTLVLHLRFTQMKVMLMFDKLVFSVIGSIASRTGVWSIQYIKMSIGTWIKCA